VQAPGIEDQRERANGREPLGILGNVEDTATSRIPVDSRTFPQTMLHDMQRSSREST
jgi:hypothetical protein